MALDLFERARTGGTGVLSTQVLQEYFVAATRNLGVSADIARRKVGLFARLQLVTLDLDHILGATDPHRLHGLSFWDALIVRAALDAGCDTLLTEDLQHGRRFEGLSIENPFLEDA